MNYIEDFNWTKIYTSYSHTKVLDRYNFTFIANNLKDPREHSYTELLSNIIIFLRLSLNKII